MAGLRSTKEKSYYWDRTQTLMLIELYRQSPCLWNVKSDVYKDRNKRAIAINGITAKLQGSGSQVNAVEVKRKIEIIRSQYRRELRKLEKSKKLGAEADDMYTPALWFFDELCFLNDGDSMRELVSNMDSEVSQTSKEVTDHEIFNGILLQQPEDQQPEDISPSHTPPPPVTRVPSTSHDIVQSATPEPSRNHHLTKSLIRRSAAIDEQHEVLQEALHQLRNLSRPEEGENDDESDFGRVVTNDLRKMNEENKVHAQKLISEVLYIGKLGKLSSSMMIVE